MSSEKKMYALTTVQGTAMGEEAYCSDHDHLRTGPHDFDWDENPASDCTGNDALSCQECGWVAP